MQTCVITVKKRVTAIPMLPYFLCFFFTYLPKTSPLSMDLVSNFQQKKFMSTNIFDQLRPPTAILASKKSYHDDSGKQADGAESRKQAVLFTCGSRAFAKRCGSLFKQHVPLICTCVRVLVSHVCFHDKKRNTYCHVNALVGISRTSFERNLSA